MTLFKEIQWESEVPYLVKAVPAQLGIGDRRVYFNVAKECLTQDGVLIDSGTLAGGTSVALAAGGLSSHLAGRRDQFLYSFDLFKCDWQTPSFFTTNFGGQWSEGSRFRKVYDDVTLPFATFMKVHEGDLLEFPKWNGLPIDVLGIDVWKTEALATHMMRVFFPSLREGSIIIHQDYRTIWLPWIHTMMEALSGYVERPYECKDGEGASVTFQVVKRIPYSAIEEAIEQHKGLDNRRKLAIAAARNSIRPGTKLFVELAHAITEKNFGEFGAASRWLQNVETPASITYTDFFAEMRKQVASAIAIK